MTVNILQATLIGVIYYFYDCPWFPNIGYTIFSKPLVIGPLVGLILGDVATGLQVGVSIQLIYMGVIVAGGSMPSDTALAGAVGSALAIMLKPTMGDGAIDAALTLAVALGMVGTIHLEFFLWLAQQHSAGAAKDIYVFSVLLGEHGVKDRQKGRLVADAGKWCPNRLSTS